MLFSLLTFTGIGAALVPRLGSSRRTLMVGLAVAVVVIVIASFGLQSLLASLITQSFPVRLVLAVAVIAPIGVLLGLAMPIGLHRFEALFPAAVPYAWAVNGLASVVASVLGVAIALFCGFRTTTLVAAACYGFALAHAVYGRWSDGSLATADAAAPAD